jgi:hypothetical protein
MPPVSLLKPQKILIIRHTSPVKFYTSLALACLFLSGCAFNVQKYGQINPKEKSITLPRGGDAVNTIIKEALAQDGWNIYTWTDAVRTTGTAGQQVDLRSSSYGQARYSLKILSANHCDIGPKIALTIATFGLGFPCLFGPSIGNLDLSVADNKTGQEILTITGAGYSDQLKQALIKGLQ